MAMRYLGTGGRNITFEGRAASFRAPMRAAATQNLMTIWNGSTTKGVVLNRVMFDWHSVGVKPSTFVPPIIRCSRLTAAPTGGQAVSKIALDTTLTSESTITCLGDAQSENTIATTTLAATPNGLLTQEVAPRAIQATTTAGNLPYFEPADRMEFFAGESDVVLRPSQGLVLHHYAPAAQFATTDIYVAVLDWEEFTL